MSDFDCQIESKTVEGFQGGWSAMAAWLEPRMDGETVFVIRACEKKETRRDAQNKLMWHWNREIKEQYKISSKRAHGESKLDVLLPLMFQWGADDPAMMARAEFIQAVMDHIPDRRVKVGVAFDMVRSKDLTVSQFAEYLTEKERHWAQQGVRLTTSDDLYFQAMGRTPMWGENEAVAA